MDSSFAPYVIEIGLNQKDGRVRADVALAEFSDNGRLTAVAAKNAPIDEHPDIGVARQIRIADKKLALVILFFVGEIRNRAGRRHRRAKQGAASVLSANG